MEIHIPHEIFTYYIYIPLLFMRTIIFSGWSRMDYGERKTLEERIFQVTTQVVQNNPTEISYIRQILQADLAGLLKFNFIQSNFIN